MVEKDIRWIQGLANYESALSQLHGAVELARSRSLTELEKQGLIQTFEFTHELAWNVMKDYFFYQGNTSITGARDAVRESFSRGLVEDGDGWMEMIRSRNLSSHTYNQSVAEEIVEKIVNRYCKLFQDFLARMQELEQQ